MINRNMLEPIDISKIPNIRYLRPEVLSRIDYDLKNRMTMMDDMREVLGAALGVLGYEPNSTNPEELEQAYS